MSLQVFNTLSNKKEEFVPLDGKNVRMYACGPPFTIPAIWDMPEWQSFGTLFNAICAPLAST